MRLNENGDEHPTTESREKYGEKFRIIEFKDRLIFLPIAEDPLEELREEWKDVDSSVEELKQKALKEGLEEAGN